MIALPNALPGERVTVLDRQSVRPTRAELLEQRRNAADQLAAQIAADRQKQLLADAAKTARLREQRLAKEAAEAEAARLKKVSKTGARRKHRPTAR
jgi:hypothetical protein